MPIITVGMHMIDLVIPHTPNEDLKIVAKLGNIFAQKSLKEKGIDW